MRHEISTTIRISAPPERVWATLLDFPRYPEWNPFVRSIAGSPTENSVLKVEVSPLGGKPMTFRPIVLRSIPPQEFSWRGKLLLSGLFDGEHYFGLVPAIGDSTQFTHGERFAGLLVPIFRGTLDRGTKAGFEAMNDALKRRVEHGGV